MTNLNKKIQKLNTFKFYNSLEATKIRNREIGQHDKRK